MVSHDLDSYQVTQARCDAEVDCSAAFVLLEEARTVIKSTAEADKTKAGKGTSMSHDSESIVYI